MQRCTHAPSLPLALQNELEISAEEVESKRDKQTERWSRARRGFSSVYFSVPPWSMQALRSRFVTLMGPSAACEEAYPPWAWNHPFLCASWSFCAASRPAERLSPHSAVYFSQLSFQLVLPFQSLDSEGRVSGGTTLFDSLPAAFGPKVPPLGTAGVLKARRQHFMRLHHISR